MSAIGAYWKRVRGLQPNARWYLWCTVFNAMTMSLSSLLLNLYLISLGFDAAFIGLNSAVLSGARLLSALPAGLIADRLGRKRAMILGLAGSAFAQLGLSTLTRGWMIVASNLVSGVLGSLFLTSVAPFMTENSSDEQRAMLFTLDSSLMNAASFVASIVGGYLPAVFASLLGVASESTVAYRVVLLVSVGTLVLAALSLLKVQDVRRSVPAHRSRMALRLWQRFSDPLLLFKLALPRVLMALGAGLVFPFLNLFFKERFGVSDAALGWILGITSVLAAVVMLWGGEVAERLGKLRAMLYARALSIPGLLIMAFVPSLPAAVLAHWTRSGLMRLGEPLYMAFAMEQLDRDERATGSSLLSTGWNVGWSIGPYISGLVQPAMGWEALFVGTVALYAFSLTLVYLFFMRGTGLAGQPVSRARQEDAAQP